MFFLIFFILDLLAYLMLPSRFYSVGVACEIKSNNAGNELIHEFIYTTFY